MLWEKESKKSGALYVNCFTEISADYIEEVTNWLLDEKRNTVRKKNRDAARFIELGDRLVREKKWIKATTFYNRAICLAEIGTETLTLAYSKRSECFWARGMYENEQIDRELAELSTDGERPAKIPRRSIRDRKSSTPNIKPKKMFQPQLSYKPYLEYPSIASVLEVKQNAKFGKHFVATCDIDVGKTVIINQEFARTYFTYSKREEAVTEFCLTCNKTDTNLIACNRCTNVMFCSQKCRIKNKTHHIECDSIFHQIYSKDLKLAIQIVLTAISIFSCVDTLMEFVEDVLRNSSENLRPANCPRSRYGLLLTLAQEYTENGMLRAYKAYKCLMKLPIIKTLFNSLQKQRFLGHLVWHHLTTIPVNSFTENAGDHVRTQFIYDTISFFNHSCAPNIFYGVKNNIGYCFTIRPVKQGEQIFINYIGDKINEDKQVRQQQIDKDWKFKCECERCKGNSRRLNIDGIERKMRSDSNYKYIDRNYDDSMQPIGKEKRKQLLKTCTEFIQSYHKVWTPTLSYVIDCFISTMIKDEYE